MAPGRDRDRALVPDLGGSGSGAATAVRVGPGIRPARPRASPIPSARPAGVAAGPGRSAAVGSGVAAVAGPGPTGAGRVGPRGSGFHRLSRQEERAGLLDDLATIGT